MAAGGGGDRDVTFRFLADVGDAVEGIKSVGTETKELAADIKTVPAAATELEAAMTRAAAAVAKLSDPKLSPRALQRAVLDADIATEGLAEAMKKAQATGGPVSADMTAKVKGFEAAVVSANARAGVLRDRLADLRVKGDQAAQGFEKMSQYGGSATSMMQGLADSSTGLVGGFGKAALAAFGVVEAFKLGYEAGEKIREAWKAWFGTEMPNLTNWFVKLGTGVDNATGAFEKHGVVARSTIGIHNAHSQAITALTGEMTKLFPEWNKQDEAVKKLSAGATILDKLLKEMGADHRDLAKFGREHADTIVSILGPALAKGTLSYATMSAEQRIAMRAALDHINALGKEADSLDKTIAKLNQGAEAQRTATLAKLASAEAAVSASESEINSLYASEAAQMKALRAMTLSDEEYNTRKRAIHSETAEAVEKAAEKEAKAERDRDEIIRAARKNEEELATSIVAAGAAATQQALAVDAANAALKGTDAAFDEVTKGSSSTAKSMTDMNATIASGGAIAEKAKAHYAALSAELDKLAEAARRADSALSAGGGGPLGPGAPG